LVLRLVGLSRSTYYYHLKHSIAVPNHRGGHPTTGSTCTSDGRIVSNEQVKEWLCELIFAEGEYYGYHKLTWALRRNYQLIINKKKVYRLCKELDILKPQRKLKVKHPRRLARNQEITASNRLWEIDLKYGYITGENRFFYILPIIDVFDRVIVDYHIGLNCTAQDAIRTVQAAMFKRQTYNADGLIIRSDNGPQFISHHFEESCIKFGIEHERIPCRTPNKNAHIESFNAILEEECLSKYEFQSYAEAYDTVSQFIKNYNTVRIHSSLKYHTPNEAYRLLQQQFLEIQPVRV